jgi:membrane-associated protein
VPLDPRITTSNQRRTQVDAFMNTLIDLFLHLDEQLLVLTTAYGPWIYGLLFVVVFAETGLVIAPFLPGDSLLFAAGALAATGALDPFIATAILLTAAIAGDAVNYAAGRYFGPRIFTAHDSSGLWHRLLNRDHLAKAHDFFERYGGKAVVMGRFVPIVRTFVPFVAGGGAMSYSKFAVYNVVGAVLWVGICLGAGYAFGNVPMVKKNFSLVVLGIIAVSLLPAVIEYIRNRRRKAALSEAKPLRPRRAADM